MTDTTWSIDKAHSEVTFAVRHMMVSTVRGTFEDFDAAIDIDEARPERSSVRTTVEVASINTGQAGRDDDLRSANFFDVERYPQMTFASRLVERAGDDAFRLVGDLTLHGVTHEIELRGEFRGPVAHPYAGTTVIGFSLTGEIDREAFGLDTNMVLPTGGVLIGKQVKIAIEAEVARAAAQVSEGEGRAA